MFDLIGTNAAAGVTASLYPNLESYPGQVMLTPPRQSMKQEVLKTRKHAVRAARHIERTNEHVAAGIDRRTDMLVGGRLMVHPSPDFETLGITDIEIRRTITRQMKRAFINWGYDSRCLCDAEGDLNFGGLMWLATRNTVAADGETAGIIHYERARRKKYNTAWATFVTVLDPDRIATPPASVDDRNCIDGIQKDEHGRRIGFWCSTQHPSEGWTDFSEPQFKLIPRETWWGRPQSWHWFLKTRGGQPRGMTKLVTIIKTATKLEKLDDAHLSHASLAAIMAFYIKTTATPETVREMLAPADDGRSITDLKLDHYDKTKLRIGEQRVPVLAPNDELHMESLSKALADPTQFRNGFLRQLALALDISFEQLSANFSDANYSAARAALLEVWRSVMSVRHMFSSHVASLIYSAVMEEAIEIGLVTLPAGAPGFQENRAAWTACTFTGPGMGWIDPLKEANAMTVRLQSKTTSRTREAALNGDDLMDVFDQIADEEAAASERGIDLTLKPSGDPMAGDSGQDGSATDKKKKAGAVPGDGDGDGIADEDNQG